MSREEFPALHASAGTQLRRRSSAPKSTGEKISSGGRFAVATNKLTPSLFGEPPGLDSAAPFQGDGACPVNGTPGRPPLSSVTPQSATSHHLHDTTVHDCAQEMLLRARKALAEMRHFSQEQVDGIAHAFASVTFDNAPRWAGLTVAETGLGNIPDKILKKRAKSEQIWNQIKDEKTVGIIAHDPEKRILRIAEPVGVVTGIAPCTNPVVTAMSYAMLAIKTRNALIISPHPKAAKVTEEALETMIAAGRDLGLPQYAIQSISSQSAAATGYLELSRHVMRLSDLVVATGGPGVVAAAYGSGTPAYGVGAGNTPVIIHPTADLSDAARKIVAGRSFDNGIICASEQSVIVPTHLFAPFRQALIAANAYWVSQGEAEALERTVYDASGAALNPAVFGLSACEIAGLAGLAVPEATKVLAIARERSLIGTDPLSGEKLFPLLTIYTSDSFEDSLGLAKNLLEFQGAGHTAALHIEDNGFRSLGDLKKWSLSMPATHLIVNQSAATSAGGNKMNWMVASTTLGCGSYGGTLPMETVNLSVKQLLNYKVCCMPLSEPRFSGRLI